MRIVIGGSTSKWRRIALEGAGMAARPAAQGPRVAASIREVCLVGDPSRRYRHRPEAVAVRPSGPVEGA